MVTDAALGEAVGPEVLDRARPYAGRRVIGLQMADDGGKVTALVQGNGPMPYRTTVVRAEGSRIGWVGACTCPVGEDCKHAVALLLSVRRELASSPAPRRARWAPSGEQELEELVAAAGPAGRADVPIGLQFELVDSGPERGRPSVGAPGAPQRLVRLRPVVPGKRGQWVRTGGSWRQLQYDGIRAGWNPAHAAALRALHATHQASRNQYWSYAPADVYLHEFGTGLWPLLTQAVADGVPLVTADRPPQPVVLAGTPADIVVDLRRDEDGAALSAVLRVNGRPVDPGALAFIGVPPHAVSADGAEDDGGPGLVLARFERPVPPALAGLVARGGSIVIPDADVDRFLRDWYPGLRQAVPAGSADGSVPLPEVVAPRLAVEIRYPGDATASLAWTVRYGPDRSFGLDAPAAPGDGPDPAAEERLVQVLPGPVGGLPELWTPERRLAESV